MSGQDWKTGAGEKDSAKVVWSLRSRVASVCSQSEGGGWEGVAGRIAMRVLLQVVAGVW